MRDFIIAAITPLATKHAGLAIATTRADGAALLDAELWSHDTSSIADENLRSVIREAPANAVIGLRVCLSQLDALRPLLGAFGTRRHRLVLAGWRHAAPEQALAALPPASNRDVWMEVSDADELERVHQLGRTIQGVLLRGLECGGWVHGDPAFILAQRAAAAGLQVPFLVQGGIGLHTAAACRTAGAAGVVL